MTLETSNEPALAPVFHRACDRCGNGMNEGYYCCDEHFCSDTCLNSSFEGSGTTWDEHYDEEGECYWSEWYAEDNF